MSEREKEKTYREKKRERPKFKQKIQIKDRERFLFWNVAGIWGKDVEFWEYIKRFDFVSLSEIWNEERTGTS